MHVYVEIESQDIYSTDAYTPKRKYFAFGNFSVKSSTFTSLCESSIFLGPKTVYFREAFLNRPGAIDWRNPEKRTDNSFLSPARLIFRSSARFRQKNNLNQSNASRARSYFQSNPGEYQINADQLN